MAHSDDGAAVLLCRSGLLWSDAGVEGGSAAGGGAWPATATRAAGLFCVKAQGCLCWGLERGRVRGCGVWVCGLSAIPDIQVYFLESSPGNAA